MVADEDYGEFTPFSLESTADMLYKRFHTANIWIIWYVHYDDEDEWIDGGEDDD